MSYILENSLIVNSKYGAFALTQTLANSFQAAAEEDCDQSREINGEKIISRNVRIAMALVVNVSVAVSSKT